MKKYLVIFLATLTISYAGLVNGIAIIINDTPITLYDIDEKMEKNNILKMQAIDILVEETLYKQELRNKNISVDMFDIDKYIDKLAAQNSMKTLQFKSLVKQQQNYELFRKQIKKQLLHQKLVNKIAKGKLKLATQEDMKIFYENNKDQFKNYDRIYVIAYISKDKKLLNKLKLNPMMTDKNVISQNITFKQDELAPQIKYILNSTNKSEFSAIFTQNKSYNMFLVLDKKDLKTISFNDAKNTIFNQLMKKREQNYLKEYFETLKITANIRILR
jgi:hypothetical protein